MATKAFDIACEIPRIGPRAEILACYYLRFNGFFILPNFIIHDAGLTKGPGQQLSDADILAIRMPHEHETIKGIDQEGDIEVYRDDRLALGAETLDFVIAEVSSKECKFNWLDKDNNVNSQYLDYALRRFGWWKDTGKIGKQLSAEKYYEKIADPPDINERVRLISFGVYKDREIDGVMQITFAEVLRFMKEGLFLCYGTNEKLKRIVSDHKQWDKLICEIYNRLLGHKTEQQSIGRILSWLFPDIPEGVIDLMEDKFHQSNGCDA